MTLSSGFTMPKHLNARLIMGKLHGNLEQMPLPMGGVLSQRVSLLAADGHLKKLSCTLMPWNL